MPVFEAPARTAAFWAWDDSSTVSRSSCLTRLTVACQLSGVFSNPGILLFWQDHHCWSEISYSCRFLPGLVRERQLSIINTGVFTRLANLLFFFGLNTASQLCCGRDSRVACQPLGQNMRHLCPQREGWWYNSWSGHVNMLYSCCRGLSGRQEGQVCPSFKIS